MPMKSYKNDFVFRLAKALKDYKLFPKASKGVFIIAFPI